jgi:hypothetical protein
MTKTRRTLFVDQQIDRAVEQMSAETARREDIEERSESQIYRDLLRQAFEQSEEVDDLLDKTDLILQRREQYIEREARLNSLRVGFEARVRKHLKDRFEDGIREEQVETFAEGLKEDARILWPDNEERRREAIRYVEQAARAMVDAMRTTDYDPLDPADVFGSYETVEESIERSEAVEREREIESEIQRRRQRAANDGRHLSESALITAVSNQTGVSERAVREVLDSEQPAIAPDRARAANGHKNNGDHNHE